MAPREAETHLANAHAARTARSPVRPARRLQAGAGAQDATAFPRVVAAADEVAGAGDAAAWSAVVRSVRDARSLLLVLHVRPDGDSLGCAVALARSLGQAGKRVAVACPDHVPASLAFLDPDGLCRPPACVRGRFDVALFLDCADLERVGDAKPLLRRVGALVNVDHHPSNTRFGDVNLIDARAAACGEIAYRLLKELRAPLDAATATALYAALATDTGSFRFENTTAHTLAAAAELMALGADAARVGREVWGSRSPAALRLLRAALGTLGTEAAGRIAWMSLTPSMLRRAGAAAGDAEGLVDYPRSLRGVEVALLFVADTPSEVRVNVRTRAAVDAAALAARFGGGGHARAAGCTLRGSLAAARRRVLAAAREMLAAAAAETAP